MAHHPPAAAPVPAAADLPAAPAAPAAPAGPVPADGPRNYRELRTNETNSPDRARLANYLQGYRFDSGGGVPQHTALREQTVIMSDRQPMSFLCLVTGASDFPDEVVILHRLIRYMDLPGEEASGFHDQYLGLVGARHPPTPISYGGGGTENGIPPGGHTCPGTHHRSDGYAHRCMGGCHRTTGPLR